MANPYDLTRGLFQGGTQQEPMWSPVPTEQEIRNEQLMNSIDSTLKNWGAAMALRNAAKKQPQQVASVQEQNLRQAEQDLREAREADAQSGSEGYEAKENGIFSRLKGFGDSTAKFLLGENYADTLEKEKSKFNEKGLLGYVPQTVNETLATMAQSPMSNFMDPTTALGGRQTMIQNLDNYFAGRGLQGVEADIQAQRELEAKLARAANTYQGVGPKTPLQLYQREYVARVQDGEDETAVLNDLSNRSGFTPDEIRYGVTPSSYAQPKTVKAGLEKMTLDRARNENLPIGEAAKRVAEEQEVPVEMALPRGNYVPETDVTASQKVGAKKRTEAFTKEGGTLDQISENAASADLYVPIATKAHDILLRHKDALGGGTIGGDLTRAMVKFGLTDKEVQQVVPALDLVYGDQMASVIDKQNSGSISNYERELFARQAVSLGDSPQELLIKLELYAYFKDLARQTRMFMETVKDQPYLTQQQSLETYYANRAATVEKNVNAIVSGKVIKAAEEAVNNG